MPMYRCVMAALLSGDPAAAFGYNPLLYILGLPSAAVFFHEYLRIVFPRLGLKPVYLSQPIQYTALGMIVLFWILRNIPAFSFLAP